MYTLQSKSLNFNLGGKIWLISVLDAQGKTIKSFDGCSYLETYNKAIEFIAGG